MCVEGCGSLSTKTVNVDWMKMANVMHMCRVRYDENRATLRSFFKCIHCLFLLESRDVFVAKTEMLVPVELAKSDGRFSTVDWTGWL